MGAAMGYNINISGNDDFHYDQSLGSLGGSGEPTRYHYVSWEEDIR
jgi:hypothetical protein